MLNNYYTNADLIGYEHHTTKPFRADFHLHNFYEIYFFISGSVNYFIEKTSYRLKYGDLLIINSNEIHKPSFLNNDTYERIKIHFDPSIPILFNTSEYNLLDCFINRPRGEQNKISLNSEQVNTVQKLFKKIGDAQNNPSDATKIIKLTSFIELLIFINNVFTKNIYFDRHANLPERLVPILDHIDQNLDGDLSLKHLGEKFHINSSYLSRLFKKSTGSNIHEYIIFKRMSKAKKLIAEGMSATKASLMCGFNDFSNFSRMFKKVVGISIRDYKREAKK